MNDTPLHIMDRMRGMMRARSPLERMRMGASMFGTSHLLVAAGIRRDHPDYNEARLRREIFLRFYGDNFDPIQGKHIADWIETHTMEIKDSSTVVEK
jgi:hypothetical protein